jgi:hypothetical protein
MAAIGRVPSALPPKQHRTSTACSTVTITAVLLSAIAYLNSYWFQGSRAHKQALVWDRQQISLFNPLVCE